MVDVTSATRGEPRPHDPAADDAALRPRTTSGRHRVAESALRLFAVHGVSGTSLQMIADDMGVTKAALYHHYRTKDELVLEVVTPFLDRLLDAVAVARLHRGWRAQAESALIALVDMIVDVRTLYALTLNDPGVSQVLAGHPRLEQVNAELVALLAGPDADAPRRATVSFFLAGLAGPLGDPVSERIGDADLRALLIGLGRRLLLTRARS